MQEHHRSPTALASTWAAELIDTSVEPRHTLRPPEDTVDETPLPLLGLGGPGAELELRGTLGEGGMAVVERVYQRSLGREVAVKHARTEEQHRRAAMVREARIVGGLEHPNIVPIHALGRDERGDAVIVMKRVSGASWRELLADPGHPLWGEGDRLLRNLEILVQVCRALELAHSRGWLHRDLKTENVMVGEFGEVYVLDWGIAVPIAIAERGEASFAGTPAYMAPEMAAAGVLTHRTDVYLLGGILHEILTGEALNQAGTLRAILDSALTERARSYPADTPPELAEIAGRATAYHPEDRFGDVASLRRALVAFVVHRDALELAEKACARLDVVDAGELEDARGELVEARSGLRQSLSLWEGNARAAIGLARCLRMLVERELADDNPSAAAGWAAQLEPRDSELEARIERRRVELEQKGRELEALRGYAAERSVEAYVSSRRRRTLAFALVVTLLGAGYGAALRAGWFTLGYLELAALFAASGLAGASIALLGMRRQNLAGRWISVVMIAAALTPIPVLLATYRLGAPAEAALALDALVKASGAFALAVMIQRVFFWAVLANLATAATLLAFPATYPIEIATGGLVLALVGASAGGARVR